MRWRIQRCSQQGCTLVHRRGLESGATEVQQLRSGEVTQPPVALAEPPSWVGSAPNLISNCIFNSLHSNLIWRFLAEEMVPWLRDCNNRHQKTAEEAIIQVLPEVRVPVLLWVKIILNISQIHTDLAEGAKFITCEFRRMKLYSLQVGFDLFLNFVGTYNFPSRSTDHRRLDS